MTPASRHRLITEAIQGSERLLLLETTEAHNKRLVAQRDRWVDRARELERRLDCALGLLAQAYPGEIKAEADLTPEDVESNDLRWPSPPQHVPRPRKHSGYQPTSRDREAIASLMAKPLPDPAAYDRTIGEGE